MPHSRPSTAPSGEPRTFPRRHRSAISLHSTVMAHEHDPPPPVPALPTPYVASNISPSQRRRVNSNASTTPPRRHLLARMLSSPALGKQHKGDLYAKELDRTRLRGEWSNASGQHVSGKHLPWSELIRKFAKHNSSQPGAYSGCFPTIFCTGQRTDAGLMLFAPLHPVPWLSYSDFSDSSA